ncbi:MAG: hypothetical protein ACI9MR_004690, partial [Myxococcota bacterium]
PQKKETPEAARLPEFGSNLEDTPSYGASDPNL